LAFGFGLLVPRDFSRPFLDLAFRLFGRALDAVFVDHFLFSSGPFTSTTRRRLAQFRNGFVRASIISGGTNAWSCGCPLEAQCRPRKTLRSLRYDQDSKAEKQKEEMADGFRGAHENEKRRHARRERHDRA
jgi:hypothetical protein